MISLWDLLTHPLFDLKATSGQAAYVKKFAEIIKTVSSVSLDCGRGSTLYTAVAYLRRRFQKSFNKKGLQIILEKDEEYLKREQICLGLGSEEEAPREQEEEEQKEQEQGGGEKRKNFCDLKSESKKRARVKNVVEQLTEDPGLEAAVARRLTRRSSSTPADGAGLREDEIQMMCLNLHRKHSTRAYDEINQVHCTKTPDT